MRVLTCHHFAYQEVFTTDYEPQTLYAADDKIFVATSQCYIEVHTLAQHGCPLMTKFPTIGTVLQLKYSKTDNFIATLEDKNAKTTSAQRAVRVYLNWPTDGSDPQPMRARIAGYMTSLRHIERQDGEKRFEVVEIPLKEKPNCIAVDDANGTLAIGVGSSVLLYGFCSKSVADSPWRYEDMKLLLELRFSFVIHQVAVCEEFIACASDRHLQIVMLRTEGQALSPTIKNTIKSKDETAVDGSSKIAEKVSAGLNQSRGVNENEARENSQLKTPGNADGEDDIPEKFKSSFNDRSFMPVGSRHMPGFRGNKKSKRSKQHSEAKAAKKKLEEELRQTGQLFGPLLKPPECQVTVEYEDTCELGDSLKYLHNSVSTYIYKKFEPSEHRRLHSLQLIPIYKPDEDSTSPTNSSGCCGSCGDRKRPLVGMYCFISTPLEGLLYKVFPCPQLLVSFPYTASSIQVCCTTGMFYVLTESGIEVYSSRCAAAALHELNSYDGIHKTLPSPTLEVCLLGLHPFIGPQMAAFCEDFLVLFSKHIYESYEMTEVNWSIYSLRTPKTLVLYHDMKELIERYHRTAVPSSDITHLLKEAHLVLERSILLCNLPEVTKCLSEVCCTLVRQLSRPCCDEWNLTLPYFNMSGMTLNQFLKVIVEAAKTCQLKPAYGKGALQVLSHILFIGNIEYSLQQEEENTVINIFSECDGIKLSRLITLTKLNNYDPVNALAKLKQWISTCMISSLQKTIALDHLCLVTLYLKVGSTKDAEAILNEMPKDDIIETCATYPNSLQEDFTNFRPLACYIWEHRRHVFIQIATRWIKDGHVTLAGILKLIESFPVQTSQVTMKIVLLEHVLSDSENYLVSENASIFLGKLYLQALQDESSSLHDEGLDDEIFSERYEWLHLLENVAGKNSQTENEISGNLAIQRRLESLLCSSHSTGNLVESVLNDILKSDNLKSSLDAVLLLCESKQDSDGAYKEILERHPHVATSYMREMCEADGTRNLLEYSLKTVAEKIRELDSQENENDEIQTLTEVFQDLLDFSVELMDPKSLLELLPPDASAQFCLPYLRKSLHLSDPDLSTQKITHESKILPTESL